MSAPADATPSAYSKDRPFPAKLTENRLLNKPGSAKETRHFVVDLRGSGLHYKAGDSLGVYPSNRSSEVDEILRHLGASGDELVSPALLKLPAPVSFRLALTEKLALAKPTRKIIETLAGKATNPDEKAKLTGLLTPESKDVLAQFLEEREFADILAEFPSAKLTPQELVDHMRKLMPRLYSIASSGRQHPSDVHLTVAIVRYETNHRERVGVCSTFLSDRAHVGTTPVPVFVSDSHFGPPEDGARDCIMVGPGTGIAPFRAFVQERRATAATGRSWLFFGDRQFTHDFLYQLEWQNALKDGALTRMDVAFSRDTPEKVYVQNRIWEQRRDLIEWLDKGAYFYVCGDAKAMAKDVRATLVKAYADVKGLSAEAAEKAVSDLDRAHRYLADTY